MDKPLLHELGSRVSAAFSKLLSVEESTAWSNAPCLTSETERFQLWAHSLGLYHEGHASLDYRVRDAVIVQDRLSELLQQLTDHLENLFSIAAGERKPAEEIEGLLENDGSSSGSSSYSGHHTEVSSEGSSFHEVKFRFQSLTERLDALYSLATRIRNPNNRPSRTIDQLYKHIPADDRRAYIHEREELETNIISYVLRQDILQNLDRGNIETVICNRSEDILLSYTSHAHWLVRRTGVANARRKQQLIYWKDHAVRLGGHNHKLTRTGPAISIKQETKENHGCDLPTMSAVADPAAPSLATSATKLPVLKPDDLKSVISNRSRISTVINMQNQELNWPPIPERIGKSEYFECPYCKTICPARYLRPGAWQNHLIHDLQPYHCTYEHCQDPIVCTHPDRNGWTTKANITESGTALNMITNTKHNLRAVVRPSENVHRDCPFCPTVFANILEMQNHLASHLERLALFALATAENDPEDDKASVRSSDSQQAQMRGRLKSVIGDFGLESRLHTIPVSRLLIGKYEALAPKLLVFFDSNKTKFTYYFQTPIGECIIEYGLPNILWLKVEKSALVIGLKVPPRFFVRSSSAHLVLCNDFTEDKCASMHLDHHLKISSRSALQGNLLQLAASIDKMLSSVHEASTQEAEISDWGAALEIVAMAEQSLDIQQWIFSIEDGLDPSSIETPERPTNGGDNMTDIRGFVWPNEHEYYLAEEIANMPRCSQPRGALLPEVKIGFIPIKRLRMDPDCAICHAPVQWACDCEGKALETAVQNAESRVMESVYLEVRNWVKNHAKTFISQKFEVQVQGDHGSKITTTNDGEIVTGNEAVRLGTNEKWKEMHQQIPEALEYYYSLIEFTLPGDGDPAVRDPPLHAHNRSLPSEDSWSSDSESEDNDVAYEPSSPNYPVRNSRTRIRISNALPPPSTNYSDSWPSDSEFEGVEGGGEHGDEPGLTTRRQRYDLARRSTSDSDGAEARTKQTRREADDEVKM
ncbi:hypothetical protein F5Y19DRAFT_469133 [Xylariaceae sp. FL1651]|nr:hypothetical protein F5Y19DRAFT_469133 [Xylariaceae sp. FL1651]